MYMDVCGTSTFWLHNSLALWAWPDSLPSALIITCNGDNNSTYLTRLLKGTDELCK